MSRMTGSNDETYCVLKGLFSGALPDTVEMVLNADDEVQELANLLGLPIGKKETFPPKDDSTDMKTPELVDEVKELSLLSGVLQDLVSCADENAILAVVQQGLNVLFDVQKVIFFLIDPDDGLLKAKIVNDQAQADSPSGLILTLQNKDSLIAQSIRKNVMLSSLSSGGQAKPAILDEQIRRLLGSEGILCLPLIHKGDAAGAIVIGVAAEEEKAVLRQKKLLKFYSTQAGTALYVERLKQTQAGKIAVERLSATTDFARKVVHEANNPLAIIKNYLKILSTRLGAESPVQREFQIIEDEIDRIARILKELSDFSKSRAFTKTVLDLNVLLGDTVRIVSQSLPATFNIKIHTDLSPEVPQIRSDRDALKQIFINLIKNAVEALAGRGNIYVETAYPPAVTETAHKQGIRGTVRVVIRDDGPGIAPEVEARLFEPYAGTKGNGHSGIGLSVVYNMIKELGGNITYGSAPGKGAVFTITLPGDAS
jgi:signal transduction histidine kinase